MVKSRQNQEKKKSSGYPKSELSSRNSFYLSYQISPIDFFSSSISFSYYNPGWFINPGFWRLYQLHRSSKIFSTDSDFFNATIISKNFGGVNMCQGFGDTICHHLAWPKYFLFSKFGEITSSLLMEVDCGVSCLTHICNEPAFGLLAINRT